MSAKALNDVNMEAQPPCPDNRMLLHKDLCDRNLLYYGADGSSLGSCDQAQYWKDISRLYIEKILTGIERSSGVKPLLKQKGDSALPKGKTAGAEFEEAITAFLKRELPQEKCKAFIDADWSINRTGAKRNATSVLSDFAQFEHMMDLAVLWEVDFSPTTTTPVPPPKTGSKQEEEHRKSIMLNPVGYLIVPDITLSYQLPVSGRSMHSSNKPILHAVVSAKLSLRSDRAQNSRFEALGLFNNRNGKMPHFVGVTAEINPGKLTSLARGTGELDSVYHIALNELADSFSEYCDGDNASTHAKKERNMLEHMIESGRLKGIEELGRDLLS